jgi:hypothetical protein
VKVLLSRFSAHRLLGCLAVLHSALILGILLGRRSGGPYWLDHLWVAIATSWLFWPIILALHPGRSILRFFLPLVIAGTLLAPCVRDYNFVAPIHFGLPEFFTFWPPDISRYVSAYLRGRADAKKDANASRLALEAFGFGTFTPGAPNFSDEVLKQCGIEINHVAGCVVGPRIVGHANGYNSVMIEEIKRRCGTAVVKAAQDEDARWLQSYADGVEAGRANARRDIQEGRLAIEVSDPPGKGDPDFEKMLRERYQIGFRRVNPHADPKMANKVFGHTTGYNEVIEAELRRRFGEKTVKAIWTSFYESRGRD